MSFKGFWVLFSKYGFLERIFGKMDFALSLAKKCPSSFYGCKVSKCSSCTRYKNLLGFFNGRFKNSHSNLTIFSEIPANLHIVTATKH